MPAKRATRVLLLVCGLLSAPPALADESALTPPDRPSVEAIAGAIENLGSASPKVVDAAEAALIAYGRPALKALDQAAAGEDESRGPRAKKIADDIRAALRIVQDAMCRPITGGTFEITYRVPGNRRRAEDVVKQTFIPDAEGNVYLRFPPRSTDCVATVRHPEYGTAQLQIESRPQWPTIRFPLVHHQSPEAAGALRGRVQGPDGTPVAGAMIDHCRLREPNKGFAATDEGAAMTDADGSFWFYRTIISERGRDVSRPVSPGSTYSFSVRVPSDPALFPCAVEHGNDSSAEVKLERAVRFRTMQFEKSTGGFLSEKQVQKISLTYAKKEQGPKVYLDPSWGVTGAKLLPGIYIARYRDDKYEPVVVTPDSPKELVFTLRKAKAEAVGP